jgi:predicted acylesterase/phospholipase RssA
MLERIFGDAIVEELPVSLFTVSADLMASRTIVHRRGSLVEAVGASMSIPGLVPPFSRPGRLLVDGGVLNNLPVDVMAADDEGPIVAIDVIRRREGVDESAVPALPTITETLSRATVLGSVERAENNRRLADLVVTPTSRTSRCGSSPHSSGRLRPAGTRRARRSKPAGQIVFASDSTRRPKPDPSAGALVLRPISSGKHARRSPRR